MATEEQLKTRVDSTNISSPLASHARRQEVRSSRGMASDWLAGRHGATLVVVIIYVTLVL